MSEEKIYPVSHLVALDGYVVLMQYCSGTGRNAIIFLAKEAFDDTRKAMDEAEGLPSRAQAGTHEQ